MRCLNLPQSGWGKWPVCVYVCTSAVQEEEGRPSHSGDKSIYKILLFNVKNRVQELLNWGSMPHYSSCFPGRTTVSSVASHQVGWNVSRIVDEEDDDALLKTCMRAENITFCVLICTWALMMRLYLYIETRERYMSSKSCQVNPAETCQNSPTL